MHKGDIADLLTTRAAMLGVIMAAQPGERDGDSDGDSDGDGGQATDGHQAVNRHGVPVR
jgi:hypothetical protein